MPTRPTNAQSAAFDCAKAHMHGHRVFGCRQRLAAKIASAQCHRQLRPGARPFGRVAATLQQGHRRCSGLPGRRGICAMGVLARFECQQTCLNGCRKRLIVADLTTQLIQPGLRVIELAAADSSHKRGSMVSNSTAWNWLITR